MRSPDHRAWLKGLRWDLFFYFFHFYYSACGQLVCVEPFEAEEEGTLAARAGDRLLVLFPPNQVTAFVLAISSFKDQVFLCGL